MKNQTENKYSYRMLHITIRGKNMLDNNTYLQVYCILKSLSANRAVDWAEINGTCPNNSSIFHSSVY